MNKWTFNKISVLRKKYLIFLFFLFWGSVSHAQEIDIHANNMALNKLLIEIRDIYNLNLSFNDQELSNYKITLHQHFDTPGDAFNFLTRNLPISFEKTGNVYLFYPRKPVKLPSVNYGLSGRIHDEESGESLPYTHVVINQMGGLSDEQGNFNFTSAIDSMFHLNISYLGYQKLDTIVSHGSNYRFDLSAGNVNLNEIIVSANPISYSQQVGTQAGLMRINHKVALLIPGNGDNSVFNLLRLQPGIMAAGDQSNDLIIWGSYAGQSQVNFDGMTLFGLKNYNDNISAVNPYMAKDIRVHKGGFDAQLGERVGGIVDITGIDGSKQRPGMNFNLNNMTMNVLAKTPIGPKISVVAAYRQTYYNLYSPNDVKWEDANQTHFNGNSILTNPDYNFRDGNLKFSGQTEKGNTYHISSFWGQDRFSYSIEQAHQNTVIEQKLDEKNRRYGIGAKYTMLWEGKGSSSFNIAYSGLQAEVSDVQNSSQSLMGHSMNSRNEQTQNDITELKAHLSGNLRISPRQVIDYGAGLIRNTTLLKDNTLAENQLQNNEHGAQVMAYLQNRYSPTNQIDLSYGIRTDYSLELKKIYLQPRLNMSFKPSSEVQFNASWGLYNQFIVYDSEIDQYDNYQYRWMISNGADIPVISSQHLIVGGVYRQNGFSFSVEGFYKNTQDISRLVQNGTLNTRYQGKNKIKGIDVFLKKDYQGHAAWISYSLAQSLEWFPYFQDTQYQNALQDQRHEFKISGLFNLSPFYLSANYVYGSGYLQNTNISSTDHPYKRFDVSGIYRFPLKKIKLETGFSILNLFNTKNIKYSNLTQIPDEGDELVSIYSEAVPFTPSVFINITF
tara:strand:- start:39252 stop:41765 length:2514 start_codon:yes stop_codon:yes gene_type:complete